MAMIHNVLLGALGRKDLLDIVGLFKNEKNDIYTSVDLQDDAYLILLAR